MSSEKTWIEEHEQPIESKRADGQERSHTYLLACRSLIVLRQERFRGAALEKGKEDDLLSHLFEKDLYWFTVDPDVVYRPGERSDRAHRC